MRDYMSYKKTFCWIIDILEKNNINYQISGGLAAISYGSKRKLYDIDIDLKKEDIIFLSKLKSIKPFIVFGPKKTKASLFKVFLLTLDFNGVLIDLGQSEQLFNSKLNKWIKDNTNFSDYEERIIFEKKALVIKKENLIKYKNILGRPEDLIDIKQIKV